MEHIWEDATDFEYCTYTNCAVSGSSASLSGSMLSGSIISDIRDSTSRFNNYDAIIPTIVSPPNTSATTYYRTGYIENYDSDTWTDWIECVTDQTLVEYSLTIYDTVTFTAYDIGALIGVFIERLYRQGITFLPTGRVGSARVGIAQVGDDSSIDFSGDYGENAILVNNRINLTTDLNNFENIAIKYSPTYHIVQNNLQYIQWKVNLNSTVSGSTPTLTNVQIGYRLNHADMISQAFPFVYRRI